MDARINLLYQVASAKMRSEPLDPSGGAIEVTVGPTVTVGGPLDEFRFSTKAGAGRRAARRRRPDRRPRHRPHRHRALGRHPHAGHGGRRADPAQRRRRRLVPRLRRSPLPLRHRGDRPGVDVERRAAQRRQLGAHPRRVPVRDLGGLQLVAGGGAAGAGARGPHLRAQQGGPPRPAGVLLPHGRRRRPLLRPDLHRLDQGELGQGRALGGGGQRHARVRHDRAWRSSTTASRSARSTTRRAAGPRSPCRTSGAARCRTP